MASYTAGPPPYSLEQSTGKGACELTVTVPVLGATTPGDVCVNFGRRALTVSVWGHALQPAVIEGALPHAVDVDACAWHLEVGSIDDVVHKDWLP